MKALPTLPLVASMMLIAVPASVGTAEDLLRGHPRESYKDVKNIDAMCRALRKSLGAQQRYSFSRSWWKWDRLRCRYVDHGREDRNAALILRAVFRALILDWHARLEKKGEGQYMYIFFTTTGGSKTARQTKNGFTLKRDHHGGGYHGGWGGAARMRIYGQLVRDGLLGKEERARFRTIVHQSLSARFLDFRRGAQTANNHAFGNAGGVALAIKMFPDAPQAKEAKAWLDRIWKDLKDFGDWTEWTYYPYGPIFLHGMLDVAEATDRIRSDETLLRSIGRRCLGFIHGSGVRGNPNSAAQQRSDLTGLYSDPWNVGYYNVETSARDGHFWYRLAQHYRDSEFLWAAQQVALGGTGPDPRRIPNDLKDAYRRRFRWFEEHNVQPRTPASRASIGLLSSHKLKIQERLYLNRGRQPGRPFAGFFLYEKKDNHLDNVAGHLYEYSVGGSKLLHSSGKYNNTYGRDNRNKGGGTGEESLDLLVVVHQRHRFPLHPDRLGDQRDFMRRGSLKLVPELTMAANNAQADSYGQFTYKDYYGTNSHWTRRAVLTRTGDLVVLDEYTPGKQLGDEYLAGPVWHLARNQQGPVKAVENRFIAPAFAHAWWNRRKLGVILHFHKTPNLKIGSRRQSHSQGMDPNMTVYAYRKIRSGQTVRFLSVLTPFRLASKRVDLSHIKTSMNDNSAEATIGRTQVTLELDNNRWHVRRR